MTLRLRTFGAVYLERDRVPLSGAHSQRRRLAFLAYLAAAGGAAITRDKLIALLWPESDDASGRHSLSQLLYSLRHDLGADSIFVDSDTIRLDPASLPSDVHEFDVALRTGKASDAVALYRGPFLDGFHLDDAPAFARWIEEERGRRASECGRALERLADAAARDGDAHNAVEWCRRRAAMDPIDSRVTQRLMHALAAIGDRDGALRAARVYEALVRDELEAEPDRAVMQLADDLRRSSPASPAASPPAQPPPPAPTDALLAPAAPAPGGVEPAPRPDPSRDRRAARRRLPAGVWALALLGVTAVLLALVLPRGAGRGTNARHERTSTIVVIGDLQSPDSVLALAVREALRAELTNSDGVVITSDPGLRQLKLLMRVPADAALVPPLLLALSSRGGAHVAVSGSVLPVGSGAQIVIDLLDPRSGQSIRTLVERAGDGPAILPAVERMARAIGAAVSQAPRDSGVTALPAVTTASLAALKSYAQARQLAAAGHREQAIAPAERAVIHDSSFVLAHYFLGDLLWFLDEQSHSDAHLTKAYDLIETVPRREQLVIRARYEQLVRDRPDSALAYWDLLRDASPGDVLAYEGRTWALRALGRHEEAAASADTAMRLDPAAVVPNTNNAMYSWLGVGDTTSAGALGARVATSNPQARLEAAFFAALFRGDLQAANAFVDSASPGSSRMNWRQLVMLAAGDTVRARAAIDSIQAEDRAQFLPRALLNQGWTELAMGGTPLAGAQYARQALEWLRKRDLSPPAVGRLAERVGALAAQAGDAPTVRAAIDLVRERDRGRGLRSHALALRTLDACLAYATGDFAQAARLAEQARRGVYFSRSLITIVQLEAEARRAAGDIATADSLERLIATHQVVDGDFETWAMLRAAAALADRAETPGLVLR